jgi:hypothetical protein
MEAKKMNKMTKSLVTASSILLLGANINAYAAKVRLGDFSHENRYEVIELAGVDTKDRAYSLGFQKLQDLKKLGSGREFSDQLGLHFLNSMEKSSASLESGYVTVQEIMNESGNIVFRARVNINYHFSAQGEHNR